MFGVNQRGADTRNYAARTIPSSDSRARAGRNLRFRSVADGVPSDGGRYRVVKRIARFALAR